MAETAAQVTALHAAVKRGDLASCVLHVEGEDQAGIVYKVSQFLAEHGLNICNLQSTVKASPDSGSTIYVMDIHIQVPEEVSMDQVEVGLSAVADELHRQYLIGFTPPKHDGKVHDIDVRVSQRGLKARARKSYIAPKEPS